jgi:hypothetical protein
MENAEIIEKIQAGLKNCSIKHNIGYEQIRVKIRNGIMGATCYVMQDELVIKNSNDKAMEVSIGDLVNINVAQALYVGQYLKGALSRLANGTKEDGSKIDSSKVNAQIFTKTSDFLPSVYLYEGTDRIREITIEDLMS